MIRLQKNIFSGFICFIFLLTFTASAQKSSVRVTVDPAEILIGEQAVVNMEVIAPKDRHIILPVYPDTLVNGIEVLHMLPADTVIAHEVMTITQKYVITSFDSTLYHIPYMAVLDGNDTIKSNSFGLKVTSLVLPDQVMDYLDKMKNQETDSIDFEQLGLTDIKPQFEPPFVWQDYLSYLWIILLIVVVLALIGVGVYMALRKKNKGYFFKPQVILPPHVIALQGLDKIKSEKIWQKGFEKQFYTELTDVLREYIEKRFMVNAFEKTSDEILETMRMYTEADSSMESLSQVLKLADLVKFAKYKPLPNENDLSLVNSYLFVNQTKIDPPANGKEENEGEQVTVRGEKEITVETKDKEEKANS